MNKAELVRGIEKAADRILAQYPNAVVRIRLLRDVLGKLLDDPGLAEAAGELEQSHWVKELAAEQREDGGWGAFHSQDTRRKQAILTTEAGVERALALGLDGPHPILQKARNYLLDVLQGRVPFPDRPEKNDRWVTGTRLFTAATLARIEPEHPELEHDRNLWVKIVKRTFQSGSYREADEVKAHTELTGASVTGSYLSLRGKYQLTLLGSVQEGLPPDLERALLAWLWERPDGIGYLTVPLKPLLPNQPNAIDRWLASHELLGRAFPRWAQFAEPVVDWLLAQQQTAGIWDFGPRPDSMIYLPLSDTWRDRKHRQFDWTVRVLTVLKLFAEKR